MRNKIKVGIISLAVVGIIIVAAGFYFWGSQQEISIENINNCMSNSDCVIVASGYCGGASAINKNYLDIWNKHLEEERIKSQGVQCKTSLPLDYFSAECINNKCTAIPIQKTGSPLRATLSLSDKPLLNIPVTLTLILSIAPPLETPDTSAKIELPQGFELISGDLNWQGNLSSNQEQKIEVVIKSTQVGYYQLKGSVLWKEEGTGGAYGDVDVIYVEISQNDAILGSEPENNWFEPAQGQLLPTAINNETIQSELIISPTPALNQEFTITYKAKSPVDISDPRSSIALFFPPKAFEIANVQFPEGGNGYKEKSQIGWRGAIKKNQTVEIKGTLKVINVGWGSVCGNLSIYSEEIGRMQDVKIAELYVDKYKGDFTIK